MARGGARPAERKLKVRRMYELRELDARTLEGKIERQVRRELIEHVGGNPSTPQRLLIERAARIVVMVETMERKVLDGDEISHYASRQILAWVNTLRHILLALGIERAERAPKALADVLRVKAA